LERFLLRRVQAFDEDALDSLALLLQRLEVLLADVGEYDDFPAPVRRVGLAPISSALAWSWSARLPYRVLTGTSTSTRSSAPGLGVGHNAAALGCGLGTRRTCR